MPYGKATSNESSGYVTLLIPEGKTAKWCRVNSFRPRRYADTRQKPSRALRAGVRGHLFRAPLSGNAKGIGLPAFLRGSPNCPRRARSSTVRLAGAESVSGALLGTGRHLLQSP